MRKSFLLIAFLLCYVASAAPSSCASGTTADGGCTGIDENFSLNLIGGVPAPVVINWSTATIVNNSSTSATITGVTTGTLAVAYTATVTTVNGTQDVSRSQLGGYNNALNMNLPATRAANTLMTVVISLTGYSMVGATFTLLDVDTSESSSPFAGWQDRVTILGANAGSSLASVNSSYTTVNGMIVTGINGNVANTSTNGNVNVVEAGTFNTIRMTFGPGPNDQRGQNQRFGLTNIAISDLTILTPEPSTGFEVSLGLALLLLGARIKRRTAK